jgi:hypothetical protein
LQLIKDFYQLESNQMVKQWQTDMDKEKQRRREAERISANMKEEIERMRAEAKRQEEKMG